MRPFALLLCGFFSCLTILYVRAEDWMGVVVHAVFVGLTAIAYNLLGPTKQ